MEQEQQSLVLALNPEQEIGFFSPIVPTVT